MREWHVLDDIDTRYFIFDTNTVFNFGIKRPRMFAPNTRRFAYLKAVGIISAQVIVWEKLKKILWGINSTVMKSVSTKTNSINSRESLIKLIDKRYLSNTKNY